jgi:hypothetical protein
VRYAQFEQLLALIASQSARIKTTPRPANRCPSHTPQLQQRPMRSVRPVALAPVTGMLSHDHHPQARWIACYLTAHGLRDRAVADTCKSAVSFARFGPLCGCFSCNGPAFREPPQETKPVGRVGIEPTTLGLRVVHRKASLAWLSQIRSDHMSPNDLRFAGLGTRFGTCFRCSAHTAI